MLLGDLGRASALLGPFQERARRLNRRCALLAAQRCRALLLTAAGQPGTALPELLAAMAALGRPAEPIEYGRCLLAAGRIQRRLRTKKAALTSLGDALAAFAATGAACWAAQAQTEIARLGPRAIGPRELIHSERQVADLAARGLTNREVARALFVSTKTVDATLSRVYRKLGMRSRTELAWHQGEGARGDPAATGPRAAGPGRDHGGPAGRAPR